MLIALLLLAGQCLGCLGLGSFLLLLLLLLLQAASLPCHVRVAGGWAR
jgi:hypothetical protein